MLRYILITLLVSCELVNCKINTFNENETLTDTLHRKSSIFKTRLGDYIYEKYVKKVIGNVAESVREVAIHLTERITIKTKAKRNDESDVDHQEL